MKRIVICAALLIVILTSCTRQSADELISENLGNYKELYGDGGDTDAYRAADASEEGGIISGNYIINDNKYYFETKRRDKDGVGISMISYIDLDTGVSHLICQDPLCGHSSPEECRYYDFNEIAFIGKGVFYSWRVNEKNRAISIYKIDLNKDEVSAVYDSSVLSLTTLNADGGRYYFYEIIKNTTTSDKKTAYKYILYAINASDDKAEILAELPDKMIIGLSETYFVLNGELYYRNGDYLRKFNILTGAISDVLSLGSEKMYAWYYDQNTKELFFNTIDKSGLTGSVYVYSDDGLQKLSLPGENIYGFALTQNDIYYSVFNPIYVGISNSPDHIAVYDYAGGVIYKTGRYDTSEAEIVYDNKGEYKLCNTRKSYCVIGGYLYFEEFELIHEIDEVTGEEYVYYASAFNLNLIRAGLDDGSFKRFTFE